MDRRNRLCRLAGAAAAILMLSSGFAMAQRVPVPCSAFTRNAYGGWTVLGPVMLDLGGRLYAPTVGTTFAAGATQNGIEMSDVLDRECGNR
jgi:hypothetical protein